MTRKFQRMRLSAATSGHRIHPGNDNAFTLVELLAVICVLTILAALSYHLLKEARTKAQLAGSANNMRSIYTMSNLYAMDHDGHAPPYETTEWSEEGTYLYVFQFLPEQYGENNKRAFQRPGDPRAWGYARNINLPMNNKDYVRDDNLPSRVDRTFKIMLMPHPSQTMFFIETQMNAGLTHAHAVRGDIYFDREGPKGKTGALFLDGHVEFIPRPVVAGENAGTPASWNAPLRTFWFGYPDATARINY